jgi:hypothetical protein
VGCPYWERIESYGPLAFKMGITSVPASLLVLEEIGLANIFIIYQYLNV